MRERKVMKKEKKVFGHKILNGNVVRGMVLLTVLAYFLVTIAIGGVIGGISGIIGSLTENVVSRNVIYFAYAISAFIMLAIHKRWFYPEYEGSLKSTDLGRWMLIAFVVLLAITVPDLIIMLIVGGNLAAPTVTSVLSALVAGITEEIIFRAIPASYGMRQINDPSKIKVVLITTALIFSLVHATNIFAGADVNATLIQLFSALGAGLLLGALFLRSGSILPSMMVHFLYDIYALMNADTVSETGLMTGALKASDIFINILLFAIEIGITVYLMRRSVHEEIMRTWEKKWNKKPGEQESNLVSKSETAFDSESCG